MDRSTTPWTIIGCGYLGGRLATALVDEGYSVRATCRDSTSCSALQASHPALLVEQFEIGNSLTVAENSTVVVTAPPTETSPAGEKLLAQLVPTSSRLLYVSTTGVYGAAAGKPVDEDFPEEPISERGQRRLDVERAIAAVHEDALMLRCPSIYGPGRGVHARLQRGEYRLIGDGRCLVSRIHVDDLVSAIRCLGVANDLKHRIFNVADDEACSAREHAMGIVALLDLEAPPTVDPTTVSANARAMLGADRQIVSERLREIGWKPAYPTWREGLAQSRREEEELGQKL